MNIREEFLNFFEKKGHKVYPSSPLVPDDASLLFTNAGMVQFKPIFTGEIPAPNPPRATSSQLCLRAGGKHNDLENVGYTARHHTLFEMLGNFSFGDYFKEKAIEYAWEFVTEVVKLPKEKLWITIHDSDDEAGEIWKKYVPAEKIIKMGDKDNFWQMGDTGPCGPCSEIHYDQGAEHFNSDEDYLGGEGDRFLEIWNLVFMQYNRDEKGNLTPLPKPSIDTGMGLERIVAIKEGVFSNYDSSIFKPILDEIVKITKKEYFVDERGASHRVIADHIRATTFLLAQGVNFDREGRGYVLRRILRRAVRHGYLLGMREPFMYKIVNVLVQEMGKQYPYLIEKQKIVKENIKLEEERFFATIDKGMAIFEEELKNTKGDLFSGEVAFKLYDTYGFPLDLTQDMLRSVNKNVEIDMFEKLMYEQKTRAKAAWKGSGDAATANVKPLIEKFGENRFVGYTQTSHKSKILALLDENFNIVDELNGNGWVMCEETPFYAESGGQIGDKGTINGYIVEDTKKFSGLNLSFVKDAKLKVNDEVECKVDKSRREIAKHHSATHLLHSACRIVLGEHITQAGSLVEADKLRFDISHPKALSSEELERIELIVNEMIANAIEGITEELPIEEAKKKGAMALFGEKYGDIVRVVSFGDASVEFCGGTHVKNTAEIGSFYITKESGVSAGVRRIEAVVGMSAYKYAKSNINEIKTLKTELKAQDISKAIEKLKNEIKSGREEIKKLKSSSVKELNKSEKDGIVYIIDRVDNADLKELVDKEKNRYDKVFIFLIGEENGKVKMACGAKNVDIKAGNFIKEIAPIVQGGGGGRPDFAQAGGKDTSKIDEALNQAKERLDA
jgi:alanyl-tRNA synthetase